MILTRNYTWLQHLVFAGVMVIPALIAPACSNGFPETDTSSLAVLYEMTNQAAGEPSDEIYILGGETTGLNDNSFFVISNTFSDDTTEDLSIDSNASFSFSRLLADGDVYNINVKQQPRGQTCDIQNGNGTVNQGDVNHITASCGNNPYLITGSVSGLVGSITVENSNGESLTISSNGAFAFSEKMEHGSSYEITITAQPPAQNCSIVNATGTVDGKDVTDVAIGCESTEYLLSGTVSGLVGTLVLQNNGIDALSVTGNGVFTFTGTVPFNNTYGVVVLSPPVGQTCSLLNETGTMPAANVTDIQVTCSGASFSVGGTVTGLAGSVTLQNNGVDNLILGADGPFLFSTALAHGAAYDVTVLSQPTGQLCSVSGGDNADGTGNINNANVNSITVSCTNSNYPVNVSIAGLANAESVTLLNNGGDALTVTGDGSDPMPGAFAVSIPHNSAYNIAVQSGSEPAGKSCTVSSGTGIINAASPTITVTCSVSGTTFQVKGSIANTSGMVTLNLNAGTEIITPIGNGIFEFVTPLADTVPYQVDITGMPADRDCNFVSTGSTTISGNISGADATDLAIYCEDEIFAVSGNITGLTGSIEIEVIRNGGPDSDTFTGVSSASYGFPRKLSDGSTYDVNINSSPAGFTCYFTGSDTGTISGLDVSNVNIQCDPLQFPVNVNVTGLTGTAVLRNNGGNDLSVNTNGSHPFSLNIDNGSGYNVTVFNQPTGQTCVVSGGDNGDGTGTINGGPVNSVSVSCANNHHAVEGSIAGHTGDVIIRNNGGDDITIPAGSFTFSFATLLPYNAGYNVTVVSQPATQDCSIVNSTGNMPDADVTNVTISCGPKDFFVSAIVDNLTGSIDILNNGGDTQTVSADGAYTFATPLNGTDAYAVSVSGYTLDETCTVTGGGNGDGTGNIVTSDVTDIIIHCEIDKYDVVANVSGLTGTLQMQNNGGDTLIVAGDGLHSFSTQTVDGNPYNVTVLTHPTGQTCVVSGGDNGDGTGNITLGSESVNVLCSNNVYTVGGTLTGLNGGSITLQNNGGDNTILATNGSFNFSNPVQHGDAYAVTVLSQPALQNCSVINDTGSINADHVDTVTVVCDPPAGVTVNAGAALVTHEDAGAPDVEFTVVLNSQPAAGASVTIPVSLDVAGQPEANITGPSFGPANSGNLIFTNADWDSPQTIAITGLNDNRVDGNISYQVVLGTTTVSAGTDDRYNGTINPPDVDMTNVDDDTAGITVNTGNGLIVSEDGTSDSFSIVLNSEPAGTVILSTISSGTPTEVDVSPAFVTFDNVCPGANCWSTPKTVTVTGVNDGIPDGLKTVTIDLGTVTTGDGGVYTVGMDPGNVTAYNLDNEDHSRTVVILGAEGLKTSESGATVTFSLVLSKKPSADVILSTITSSKPIEEGNVTSSTTLTFTPTNWDSPQNVTVQGALDDGDAFDDTYTINLGITASADPDWVGVNGGTVNITNVDVPYLVTDYIVSGPTTVTYTNVYGSGGEIQASWTQIGALTSDDEGYQVIPIGFNFEYIGKVYSNVTLETNGFISFDPDIPTNYLLNSDYFHDPAYRTNVIAFWLDDFDLTPASYWDVFYKNSGTAPNRLLSIEWYSTDLYCGGYLTGKIILHESSNDIEFQYSKPNVSTSTCWYAAAGITDDAGNFLEIDGNTVAPHSIRTDSDWPAGAQSKQIIFDNPAY